MRSKSVEKENNGKGEERRDIYIEREKEREGGVRESFWNRVHNAA